MFAKRTTRPIVSARRLSVAGALAAALLGAAACAGQVAAAPVAAAPTITAPTVTTSTSAPAPAPSSTTSTSPVATQSSSAAAPHASASSTPVATNGPAPCGNGDLQIFFGYGTQSEPDQAAAVVFVNISSHTCTMRGYPGVAIAGDGKVINATRVLNGSRGNLPPLSSPPLVTLAPKATAYAVVQWVLGTGNGATGCVPAITGDFEATAPNTTGTVVISTGARTGPHNICSGLEINPVVPGVFGIWIPAPKNAGIN